MSPALPAATARLHADELAAFYVELLFSVEGPFVKTALAKGLARGLFLALLLLKLVDVGWRFYHVLIDPQNPIQYPIQYL